MGMFFFQPFPALPDLETNWYLHVTASQGVSDQALYSCHEENLAMFEKSMMKWYVQFAQLANMFNSRFIDEKIEKHQSVPYFFTLTFKAALKTAAVIAVFFTSRADSTPCLAIETHQGSNQLDSARNLRSFSDPKTDGFLSLPKAFSFYCWQHKPLQICLAV